MKINLQLDLKMEHFFFIFDRHNFVGPLYKKVTLYMIGPFKLVCLKFQQMDATLGRCHTHWISHGCLVDKVWPEKKKMSVPCGVRILRGWQLSLTQPCKLFIVLLSLIMLFPSSNQSAEDLMFTFWFDMFWDQLLLIS